MMINKVVTLVTGAGLIHGVLVRESNPAIVICQDRAAYSIHVKDDVYVAVVSLDLLNNDKSVFFNLSRRSLYPSLITALANEVNKISEEIRKMDKPKLNETSTEDVDDLYQAQLEYNWWVREKLDESTVFSSAIRTLIDDGEMLETDGTAEKTIDKM